MVWKMKLASYIHHDEWHIILYTGDDRAITYYILQVSFPGGFRLTYSLSYAYHYVLDMLPVQIITLYLEKSYMGYCLSTYGETFIDHWGKFES